MIVSPQRLATGALKLATSQKISTVALGKVLEKHDQMSLSNISIVLFFDTE